MASHPKSVPLVAPGHTRPVTHLSFSPLQDDGKYVLISSCKDGNPMLREWTGDWIGTFFGHKGAVWSSKLTPDTSRAASGSADFTAYVSDPVVHTHLAMQRPNLSQSIDYMFVRLTVIITAKSGTRTAVKPCTRSRTITSSAVLRSRRLVPTCSLEGRRRRSGCSTCGDRTRNRSSSSRTAPQCPTMALSRALSGWVITPVLRPERMV